jgi:hypothetical protein
LSRINRKTSYWVFDVRTWRRERQAGILEALKPRKRGPRSERNPLAEENQKLRRQNARLTEDLRKAQLIIDVQKKSCSADGEPSSRRGPGREILMSAVSELAIDVGTSAACQVLWMPRASYYWH